jgi:DNA-binding protein YbaB
VSSTDEMGGRLRRLDELRTAIGAAEATATSSGGEVAVVVRPGGVVTGLTIASRGMRAGTHALSELIVATARAAAAELGASLTARAAELSGGVGSFGAVLTGAVPPLGPAPDEAVAAEEAGPPPPGFPAFEGVEAALRQLRTQAAEQHARYAEAHERLASLTATATDPDAAATATVAQGGLVALDIEPVALRSTAQELADAILQAIRAATAELAQALAAETQPLAGPLDIAALVNEYQPASEDGGGRE